MKKKMMSAGGNMKKKGYAAGGATMKKKMMAGGGTMKKKMMSAGGATTQKKKMMAGGGASMKKKSYAAGGVAKKKLFAGSYVFSDTAGTKMKSRFSEDKKKKEKKKDDSASYAKVAAKRKRDAEQKKRQGILNRDTKNRKVATSMQSKLQKSKGKKTDVGKSVFVGASIELKPVPKNKKEKKSNDKKSKEKKSAFPATTSAVKKVRKLLGISEDKKSFNTLYKPPKEDKKEVTKAERDRVNRLFGIKPKDNEKEKKKKISSKIKKLTKEERERVDRLLGPKFR